MRSRQTPRSLALLGMTAACFSCFLASRHLPHMVRIGLHTLPTGIPLCYKPDMRKWMRERVKRRKKAPETGTAEPAQAPLQPAFYDVEPPAAEPPAKVTEPEISAPPVEEEEPQEL